MRMVNIQVGKNKGTHYIFDSATEAVNYLTGDLQHLNMNHNNYDVPIQFAFPFWHEFDKYGDKDWVMSDDGRVLQCLKTSKMFDKKYPTYTTGNEKAVYYCKTAIGQAYKKTKKDGTFTLNSFNVDKIQTQLHHFNKSSLTNVTTIAGKYLTKRKAKFAYHVSISGDPVRAYNLAMPQNSMTFRSRINVMKKAFLLLTDKYVLKEVFRYMAVSDFKEKLKAGLETNGIDIETLTGEFSKSLKSAIPGSKNKLEHLQMAIKMWEFIETEQQSLPSSGKQVDLGALNTSPQNAIPENVPNISRTGSNLPEEPPIDANFIDVSEENTP